MEKYVCNLEHAKKLKKLGVKQKSEFYWIPEKYWCNESGCWKVKYYLKTIYADLQFDGKHYDYYSAFLVGELGEILPYHFYTTRSKSGFWYPHYKNTKINCEKTEANARASAVEYLIENKLIQYIIGRKV